MPTIGIDGLQNLKTHLPLALLIGIEFVLKYIKSDRLNNGVKQAFCDILFLF